MDEDLRERVERAAEKHALFNALKHGGEADVGALMGPLMGENPEFRPHGDEIPGVVAGVVADVNAMSEQERHERLRELAPEEYEAVTSEDEAEEGPPLPDLPNAEEYDEIRMRAAPNPNGPWHIGHARMPSVIGTYKEMYDGHFIVRFDDTDPETVLSEFGDMVDGKYESGDIVLRVKTDIEHKNPALRDFVAFRMVDTPHPREVAADYRCWPMLDFQSGIDDHLTGVTHIIRGIDLQDSAKKQRFVYDYFGWEYPEVMHWGHVQVDAYDVKLSTSTLKAKIDAGELDGWDDPRAPTIRSIRRRGIRGQALVEAMVDLGVSTSNVDLAMSSVYANNRDIIDDAADRCFFVRDGVRRDVVGGPDAGHPPRHPDHEDRGRREIPVTGGVLVEEADLPPHGDRVWLKGYGCVRHTRDAFEYTGDDIDVVREGDVDVVHWVPAEENVPLTLRTMEGDDGGHAEPGYADYDVDDVVQFERIGFARVDEQNGLAGRGEDVPDSVAYYAHP